MNAKMITFILISVAFVSSAFGQDWKQSLPKGVRLVSEGLDAPMLKSRGPMQSNAFGQQAVAQSQTRPAAQATNRPSSGMMIDDLAELSAKVNNLTPITVGKPMPMEQMQGYYGGYNGFGGGFGLPGSQYPQYSSMQPAQQLPAYVQQELFEEYQRQGVFNPLLPSTDHMAQHLGVLEAEARTGQNRLAERPIGPDTWSTTKYVVVSSLGILDEQTQQRMLNGQDAVRIAQILGVGKYQKFSNILSATLGQTRAAESNRTVVGVLYVAIVDLETRSVIKSSTGIAAISYRDFAAVQMPVITTTGSNYPGAGKFARELVLSALYDSQNRASDVERFTQRRR